VEIYITWDRREVDMGVTYGGTTAAMCYTYGWKTLLPTQRRSYTRIGLRTGKETYWNAFELSACPPQQQPSTPAWNIIAGQTHVLEAAPRASPHSQRR
jgi:hypothetical protein